MGGPAAPATRPAPPARALASARSPAPTPVPPRPLPHPAPARGTRVRLCPAFHAVIWWRPQLRRAAQRAALAPAGLTAQQNRLTKRLDERQDACDWLGVAALEREALALAREMRGANPGMAGAILNLLGVGFLETGDYARACEMHAQARAIAEAPGDRAGVVNACLGNCRSVGWQAAQARGGVSSHVLHTGSGAAE